MTTAQPWASDARTDEVIPLNGEGGEFPLRSDLSGCASVEADHRLALRVTASLGMEPRLLRLMTAVHEAGHAIVGATVGLDVTEARVTSYEIVGSGGDYVDVDSSRYPARIIPLPDLLAFTAAGYQATFTWLEGRGIDAAAEPYDHALNALASGDLKWCLDACHQLGKPGLTMQQGIEGAARILKCRWRAVLRLAYILAARGLLAGDDLRAYLAADLPQFLTAIRSYYEWRQQTSHLWRRDAC